VALLLFTEYNTHIAGETSVMLFKRGARAPVVREIEEKSDLTDEEKGISDSKDAMEKARNDSGESISVPMMADVFTWRHIEYDVVVGKGETRRLLDDISGYVAPGKLTALMGESGAGKVGRLPTVWQILPYTFLLRPRC
jgi:ATP-binding cassette, subfamily G (WHITE), member 2, SNQ2